MAKACFRRLSLRGATNRGGLAGAGKIGKMTRCPASVRRRLAWWEGDWEGILHPGQHLGVLLLTGQSPRWISTILPGVVKTDHITVRIMQIRLSPQPRLILGLTVECDSPCLEACHHGHARIVDYVQYPVNREGPAPLRTLESRIRRQFVHYLNEPKLAIELHSAADVGRWKGNLVEVHDARRLRLVGKLAMLALSSLRPPALAGRACRSSAGPRQSRVRPLSL